KTSKLLKIMRIMEIMGIRVPTKHPFNPRDLRAIKFYSLTRCWKSKALVIIVSDTGLGDDCDWFGFTKWG
ncbi:MAG: hypothetical protein LRZ88_12570, partial [Candidatus Cloacimonetes bacterium]|nr:hypothetical protein [Candidatus Cloacimonadota bacterium]